MSTRPQVSAPFSIGNDIWPGLAKLIEECGEVQQVAGKLIALGGVENYTHWDGTDIKERLTEELGDVLAAISFFVDVNNLDWAAINAREEQKKRVFHRWHNEAML